jgi:hypothetical protein
MCIELIVPSNHSLKVFIVNMIDPESVDDDAVQKTLNMEQRTRAMLKANNLNKLKNLINFRKICRMVVYQTEDF